MEKLGDSNFDFSSPMVDLGQSMALVWRPTRIKVIANNSSTCLIQQGPPSCQLRGAGSCSSMVQTLDAGFPALTPSADSQRLRQLPLARARLSLSEQRRRSPPSTICLWTGIPVTGSARRGTASTENRSLAHYIKKLKKGKAKGKKWITQPEPSLQDGAA